MRRTNGFTIRPGRREDFPALWALSADIFEHDFGYPKGHEIVLHRPDPLSPEDFETHFREQRGHALLVAEDDATAEVIGMAGVKRVRGGLSPKAPRHLIERLDTDTTAEIVRVYIHRDHRRRGVARALVEAARAFVRSQPEYTTLYCHTDAAYPQAPHFWSTLGRVVHDNRTDPGEFQGNTTLYFELPLER